MAMIAAIGDIHGCSREMDEIIRQIELVFRGRNGRIVFLGDYVDRGPDSRGVIDRLRDWNHPSIEITCLRGNHEEMMIRAILHSDIGMDSVWISNGGVQTMWSIGQDDLAEYARWLDYNTVVDYEQDGLIFVHAGLNPDRSMDDQRDEDKLWIRDRFLNSHHDFGKMVVHGHTPTQNVEVRSNRIGLDTGCVYGGKLSAAIFEDGKLVKNLSVKS